jgi:hydrogenase-4 membrane subunit HyfE
MNKQTPAQAFAVLFAVGMSILWLILLVTSILSRPRPEQPSRLREKLLITTAVLMLLSFVFIGVSLTAS